MVTARRRHVSEALALAEVSHDTSRLGSERLVMSRLVWLVRQQPATAIGHRLEVTAANGQSAPRALGLRAVEPLWERGELVADDRRGATAGRRSRPARLTLRLVFERPEGLTPVSLGSIVVPACPVRVEQSCIERCRHGRLGHSAIGAGSTRPARQAIRSGRDPARRWICRSGGNRSASRRTSTASFWWWRCCTRPGGDVVSEPRRPGDWFSPLPFWQHGDVVEQNVRLRAAGLGTALAPIRSRCASTLATWRDAASASRARRRPGRAGDPSLSCHSAP